MNNNNNNYNGFTNYETLRVNVELMNNEVLYNTVKKQFKLYYNNNIKGDLKTFKNWSRQQLLKTYYNNRQRLPFNNNKVDYKQLYNNYMEAIKNNEL